MDETGFIRDESRRFGWARIGQQAVITGETKGKRLSVIGAMNMSGPVAAMTFTGTLNQERMLEYISDHLGPTLKTGDILVMDGLRVHWTKRVLEALKAYGVKTLVLPLYCPELNPIEMLWSTLKPRTRAVGTPTWDSLVDLVRLTWNTMDSDYFARWVAKSGYSVPST